MENTTPSYHQRLLKGERLKNLKKQVIKNIPDSGVVFTLEEGISTSHVCPKRTTALD